MDKQFYQYCATDGCYTYYITAAILSHLSNYEYGDPDPGHEAKPRIRTNTEAGDTCFFAKHT